MCWVQIVIAIIIAIVGEAIRPKAKGNTSRPAGLGDFQFPTSEAGRVFPWIAGTVKVLGPNTTASGNLRQEESYTRVKTGWWTTTKQSYGWRYYLTFQQIVCGGPIDDVVGIQVNDKFLKATKTATTDYIDLVVSDASFFGDAKKDGGFSGTIRFWRGTATQTYDDKLLEILSIQQTQGGAATGYNPGAFRWADAASDPINIINQPVAPDPSVGDDSAALGGISAYRYVCYMMFRDFYIGMSSNPSPFVPVLSRWPNSLGVAGGKHIINGTASNVICAAYDLLVDNIRGMGVPASAVDTAAFLAAADTCYNEGIGVNLMIDGSQSGEDAINATMAYADGQVFQDPFTGLWTVKLARADYDIDTLPVLDETNSRVTGRTKTDWPDTKNVITVAYLDKDKNWTNQSVQVSDSANLSVLGQTVNATTLERPGVDNAALANFLAERARAAMATPFSQLQIEAQGIGLRLKPNSVFVASYPSKRINRMVMRVTDITYPTDAETTVTLEAIEDKFGVKYVAYNPTPPPSWTPPSAEPLPALIQRLDELPYGMTPNLDGGRYVMTMAVRSGSIETGYDVLSDDTGKVTNTVDDPTSAGLLVSDFLATGATSATAQANGIKINNVIDAQWISSALATEYAIGTSMLLIGNELIAFQNATDNGDGTMTFWPWTRACYDTIPAMHPANSPVFIVSSGSGLVQDTPLAADATLKYKLLMRVAGEVQAASDATEMSIAVRSRAKRPYPPGNVVVEGQKIQNITSASNLSGQLDLSWASRNRLTSGASIVDYGSAGVTPEDGAYFALQFFDSNGVLLVQKLDISGSSASAILNYTGTVRMIFYSRTDAFDSYFKYDITFNYTPPAGTTGSSITAGTYTPTSYVLDGGGA